MSYLAAPGDLSLRRLSDVAMLPTWGSRYAHELLSGPMGRHQLSLLVGLTPPTIGNGWTIGRSGSDFTDVELHRAGALLPLLTTHDRLYTRTPVEPTMSARQAIERANLTPRELRVLALVADGLTAVAIGHVCRISSATVRKHLEHLYAKLDCHDRLMAVQHARRLGLLPALTSSES